MSVLRAAPYNLAYNTLVVVQIRARNTIDWGDFSPLNTIGALIQV